MIYKICGKTAACKKWYHRMADRFHSGHSTHMCLEVVQIGFGHNCMHRCSCGTKFLGLAAFTANWR